MYVVGLRELTLDSVVLCPGGVSTAVLSPGSRNQQPAHTSSILCLHPGGCAEPTEAAPSPRVPTSLIHWNLLPALSLHLYPLVSKRQNSKTKTTAPRTDFNTVFPLSSFLNTKELYIKYCFRAHFSYSFPCKCFCTLSAKDLAAAHSGKLYLMNNRSHFKSSLPIRVLYHSVWSNLLLCSGQFTLWSSSLLLHSSWLKVYN